MKELLIEILEIPKDGLQIDEVLEPELLNLSDDVRGIWARDEVEVHFFITKNKQKVKLTGSVKTKVELVCSRCLTHFKHDVNENFRTIYLPKDPEIFLQHEIRLRKQDLEAVFYEEPVINLLEETRQRVMLAVPVKPLCKQDCKGICWVCGKNLNEGECGCDRHVPDPRFAVLEKLLEEMKEEEEGGVNNGSA